MKNLLDSYTFNSGVKVPNRIVMAPMTSKGSSWDGIVENDDFDFYERRSLFGALLITGATAVSRFGEKFSYQMSAYDDRFIDGLSKLSSLMKKDGNLAISQLYHSGLQSVVSFEKLRKVYSPSKMLIDNEGFPYETIQFSEEDIQGVIKDFVDASTRVINAGFDGVEIHGAYRHLLQQFFSPYYNHRDDLWGGDINSRMKFPLEITKRILEHLRNNFDQPIIVGYRLTEIENHREGNGYSIEDTLELIDSLCETGIDYIHTTSNEYGKEIKEVINERTAFIYVPQSDDIEVIKNGLRYGDFIAMASNALAEPDFASKLQLDEPLNLEIKSVAQAKDLKLPTKMLEWLLDPNTEESVPKGMHFCSEVLKERQLLKI